VTQSKTQNNGGAHSSAPRNRRIIAHGEGSAADMIGPLRPGCEIFGLTGGQFSFIDIMEHCLAFTGPAHCVVATWTAAGASIKKAARFARDGRVLSCRWLVDRSFRVRQPELCGMLVDAFGDECIRTASSHAKFMLIHNELWNLAIRTSMNLNQNPRIEDFEISDDRSLCKFVLDLTDRVFADTTNVAGFSTKNETSKIVKHFERAELCQGKIQLNGTRIKLNA